ncbi:MAG TPA: M57 family metalloprotease [Chitinophagaceae bacterium]|nr:M57 family metalloprotease [Chitinophagaceae bacterium]
MRHMLKPLAFLLIAGFALTSCKKEVKDEAASEEISQEILTKIYNHGFGTTNVQKIEEGYLVEGDIILTEEYLNSVPGGTFLRIANNEQYRTTNLVSAPRTITVSLDAKLSALAGYPAALQEMVNRYNAENLSLTFQKVGSGGDIRFVNANGPYLASAGFPSSNGSPYGQVKVYSRNIGSGSSLTFINFLATILAHEAGHCIGFRHTDYMDRSYSCGGAYANEGASSIGAIHIPGTPQGPDARSWMLACISRGENRPFNPNDQDALDYLY